MTSAQDCTHQRAVWRDRGMMQELVCVTCGKALQGRTPRAATPSASNPRPAGLSAEAKAARRPLPVEVLADQRSEDLSKPRSSDAVVHASQCSHDKRTPWGERFGCNCGAGVPCPRCGTTEPREVIDSAKDTCFDVYACERRKRTNEAVTSTTEYAGALPDGWSIRYNKQVWWVEGPPCETRQAARATVFALASPPRPDNPRLDSAHPWADVVAAAVRFADDQDQIHGFRLVDLVKAVRAMQDKAYGLQRSETPSPDWRAELVALRGVVTRPSPCPNPKDCDSFQCDVNRKAIPVFERIDALLDEKGAGDRG